MTLPSFEKNPQIFHNMRLVISLNGLVLGRLVSSDKSRHPSHSVPLGEVISHITLLRTCSFARLLQQASAPFEFVLAVEDSGLMAEDRLSKAEEPG